MNAVGDLLFGTEAVEFAVYGNPGPSHNAGFQVTRSARSQRTPDVPN